MTRRELIICIACYFPSVSLAQVANQVGTLESILVTAAKRPQFMQEIPQTVTEFSARNIEDIGAQDFAGLTNSMAGVELRQKQAGQGGVAIRGIAELNMAYLFGGTGSATGVYLDEMSLTSAGRFPVLSLFDIQRIEVLKGPQGTLFGEGSLAGTVRFIANKPVFNQPDAAVDMTFSQNQGGGKNHTANLMGNIPLSPDAAALRVSIYERQDGGYTDARITDGTSIFDVVRNANTQRSTGGLMALRIAPHGALTITGTILSTNAQNGFPSLGIDGGIGSFSTVASNQDTLNTVNLNTECALSFADLVANVAHSDRKILANIDGAGFLGPLNGLLGKLNHLATVDLKVPWVGSATGLFSRNTMNAKSDILELRLVSRDHGSLRWTGGGYFKKTSTLISLDGNLAPAVPDASWAAVTGAITHGALAIADPLSSNSSATINQGALFGEVSTDFTEQFQLLLGGRVFKETRNSFSTWSSAFAFLAAGSPPGSAATRKSSALLIPRITATYKITPAVVTYGTYSQGFRSGGQNDFLVLTPGAPADYNPERLVNHELGLKATSLNNTLLFNLSGYYMKWKDLQEVVAQGNSGIGAAVGNVGNAHSTGIDLDTKWRPTKAWEFSLNASLLKAVLDDNVVLGSIAGRTTVPGGTRIPGTAKQSFSLGTTYRRPLSGNTTGFLGGRISSRGDIITSLPFYKQTTPGSTAIDLKAGVEAKPWQIYGFINNAANKRVALQEYSGNPDIFTGQRAFYWGNPRTVGINLRMSL